MEPHESALPGNQDGDITHQIDFWIRPVLLPGNDYAIDPCWW